MTIYRLNRVPDKLHVTLLELLGIQLDGPSSAATDVRFRLVEPPTEPLVDPAAARPRSPRRAPPTRRVDHLPGRRGLHDPGRAAGRLRAPARRPGQGRRRRRRPGAPTGRRPLPVRQSAGGRRRALPRLRRAARAAADPGRRRRLARARRRRQPRGPAAALGGLAGRQPAGRRRSSSRTSPAASTTAPARSSCSCPPRSAIQPLGGHRMHWLRCRIDDKTRHGGAATTYTQAPEIYSITAAPVGALLPASHAAQEENEVARRVRRHARARPSRCATPRC